MSLLGIDIGTSACKAAAHSARGECLASAHRAYPLEHPEPGWAQLNSHRVWECVREVISEVAHQTQRDPISALCATSFGEGMVPVGSCGQILGPTILSMDPRGQETALALERDFGKEGIYRISANPLGVEYSLPKILWLRRHLPELFDQTQTFLLWGDLVGYLLGGEKTASHSLACRTLLLDHHTGDWNEDLLKWAHLDRGQFGKVVAAGVTLGEVSPGMAAQLGLPRGARIVSGGHDQCLNALGSGAIADGDAVWGIGTYECITPCLGVCPDLTTTYQEGLSVEPHVVGGQHVGFLFNQGGALLDWYRHRLVGGPNPLSMETLMGEMPDGPSSVWVLPHFFPPPWPLGLKNSSGAILGLSLETTRGDILKGIMEGSTFHFVHGIRSLEKMGVKVQQFTASGGGARSNALLQIKANIMGVPFVRNQQPEGGLLGASMLAGMGTGVYHHAAEAVVRCVVPDQVFEPVEGEHQKYLEKFHIYDQIFPTNRENLSDMGAWQRKVSSIPELSTPPS